jgi:hypothetical protein
MAKNLERWCLASAWAVILTCGAAGVLFIRSENRIRPEPPLGRAEPAPPSKPAPDPVRRAWDRFQASQEVIPSIRVPLTPYVGCMIPELRMTEIPQGPWTQFILPKLLFSGTVGMDRATVTWTLEEPKLVSTPELVQKRSAPKAIVIHRQYEDGEFEPLAVLDPRAKFFEDREVQPNRSYRYWVFVRGDEGSARGHVTTVRTLEREGTGDAEIRVPAWHRVTLKGGDREHAILGVESYNPQKGKWETRTVMASPGQKIQATGWMLEGMRFDRSTLVAEVTDDRQDKRDLSTRKKD